MILHARSQNRGFPGRSIDAVHDKQQGTMGAKNFQIAVKNKRSCWNRAFVQAHENCGSFRVFSSIFIEQSAMSMMLWRRPRCLRSTCWHQLNNRLIELFICFSAPWRTSVGIKYCQSSSAGPCPKDPKLLQWGPQSLTGASFSQNFMISFDPTRCE